MGRQVAQVGSLTCTLALLKRRKSVIEITEIPWNVVRF